MKIIKAIFIIICLYAISCVSFDKRMKPDTTPDLPSHVWKLAQRGWSLYKAGDFKASRSGGHYTDPASNTRVSDFWMNGVVARVDRDDNGSHETIFIISNSQLEYIGTIGGMNVFEVVTPGFEKLLGKSLRDLYINWLLQKS